MKAYQHFKTITTHKLKVMQLCFRCGLYKQGLLHDLSKYTFTEFIPGAKHYQGTRSPNERERELYGYSQAWLHHKGRNKHHYEYWMDVIGGKWVGCKMPVNYVVEMFCDRVAASMIYEGKNYTDSSALEYYNLKCHAYIMHEETQELIYSLLVYLSENGLDKTIAYIKKNIL